MTQSSGSESFELVWHVQDQLNRDSAKFDHIHESFINRTFNCSYLELGEIRARAFINCTFPNLVQLKIKRADRRSFVQCNFPRIEYHRQIIISTRNLEDVFIRCKFTGDLDSPRETQVIQHDELIVLERYNSPGLADLDKDTVLSAPDNPIENTAESLNQSTLGKSLDQSLNQSTLGKSLDQSTLRMSLGQSTLRMSPGKDSLGQSTLGQSLNQSILEKSTGKENQSTLGMNPGKDSLNQSTLLESTLDLIQDDHEIHHDRAPPQDDLSETEVSEQSRTEVSDDVESDEEPQPINPTESYSGSLSISREGKLKFKPNIQHDEEENNSVFSLAGKMVVLGLKTVFQK